MAGEASYWFTPGDKILGQSHRGIDDRVRLDRGISTKPLAIHMG